MRSRLTRWQVPRKTFFHFATNVRRRFRARGPTDAGFRPTGVWVSGRRPSAAFSAASDIAHIKPPRCVAFLLDPDAPVASPRPRPESPGIGRTDDSGARG